MKDIYWEKVRMTELIIPPEPKKRPSGWTAAQKVAFRRYQGTTARSHRKLYLVDAYIESLEEAAKRGDVNAIRERTEIAKYLDKHDQFDEPERRSPSSIAFNEMVEKHQKMRKTAIKSISGVYGLYLAKLNIAYLERTGREIDFEVDVMMDIDRSIVSRTFSKTMLAHRRAGTTERIGYKRPPLATQWRPSQSGNPSGKRKEDQDGWASFRLGCAKLLPVIQNGRSVKLTTDEVMFTQLFNRAIQGNHRARRAVRMLLIQLHERKLLKPPAPRRRRPRKTPEEIQRRERFEALLYVLFLSIRSHCLPRMQPIYEKVFGEQHAYEEIWRECEEERRQAVFNFNIQHGASVQ